MLVNIISDVHKSTKRDYLSRMTPEKPSCMAVSRGYGRDYWDGERKYGYGGYRDDGRWKEVAKRLIDRYKIDRKTSVLDVGCGKGFLAREIKSLTDCEMVGCDVSSYALDNCAIDRIFQCDIGKENLPDSYDVILSINTLHNLTLPRLKHALVQIASRSQDAYVVMDSYRNEAELHNLQCWALTAEQFNRPEEWEFLFKEWGYRGDWEFIFFE